MAIRQGNSDVSAIFLGNTEITKVYQGTVEIYSAVAPPVFVNYNITDFDNGLLGASSSQYDGLENYNDLTYIKIQE